MDNDFSIEYLYEMGLGFKAVNNSSKVSIEDWDGDSDALAYEMASAESMIDTMDVFSRMSAFNSVQQIKCAHRISANYGHCNRGIESYCRNVIQSAEDDAGAAGADTGKDADKNENAEGQNGKNAEKKVAWYKKMFGAIATFLKKIWEFIKSIPTRIKAFFKHWKEHGFKGSGKAAGAAGKAQYDKNMTEYYEKHPDRKSKKMLEAEKAAAEKEAAEDTAKYQAWQKAQADTYKREVEAEKRAAKLADERKKAEAEKAAAEKAAAEKAAAEKAAATMTPARSKAIQKLEASIDAIQKCINEIDPSQKKLQAIITDLSKGDTFAITQQIVEHDGKNVDGSNIVAFVKIAKVITEFHNIFVKGFNKFNSNIKTILKASDKEVEKNIKGTDANLMKKYSTLLKTLITNSVVIGELLKNKGSVDNKSKEMTLYKSVVKSTIELLKTISDGNVAYGGLQNNIKSAVMISQFGDKAVKYIKDIESDEKKMAAFITKMFGATQFR